MILAGTHQKTVRDLDRKREVLAKVFAMALGKGSEENRIAAGMAVLSKEGFHDRNTASFSKNIGNAFFCLTEPSYILFIAITSFIYTMAWQPLLSAAASRGESSSKAFGGMGFILRVVDYVLRRGCFVEAFLNSSLKRNQKLKERLRREGKNLLKPWDILLVLGHRGLPRIKCNGRTLLSRRLQTLPKGWKSLPPPSPSPSTWCISMARFTTQ